MTGKRFGDMTPEEQLQATRQWLLEMDPEQCLAIMIEVQKILKMAGDGDDRRTVAQVLAGPSN